MSNGWEDSRKGDTYCDPPTVPHQYVNGFCVECGHPDPRRPGQ